MFNAIGDGVAGLNEASADDLPGCRRKIEMSPGVQSRDDTRVPDEHEERDLDGISAGDEQRIWIAALGRD